MRVLVDTNVIIDVLLKRPGFFSDSQAVLRLAVQGDITALVPAGSMADIYYIIRRGGLDSATAHGAIASLAQLVEICDTAASDVKKALRLKMGDFEDAVMAATAKREKAKMIISRNDSDFSASPVPVITPKDFISSFFPHFS